MKTKISLATAVVLGASSLYGGSIINDDIIGDSLNKEVRVDNTKVNALEKKVLQLEKTLQSQQKYIKGLELKVNKKSKSKKVVADKEDDMSEQVSTNSDDIEDLDERLEIIETRSFTDKIQFGLGMRVEMNNYSNTYADGHTYDANDIWRTKLNLNMKSKLADNLKFTGRLSMYKNWGDSTTRNVNFDSMQGRKPDGSQLYVERAYLD